MKNSIFRKSSYRQKAFKKKKITWNWSSIQGTRVHGTQVPYNILQVTWFSLNRVSKHGHFATCFGWKEQMSILAKLVVAIDFEYVITYTTKHYFAQLYYREFVTKPNFLRVHNYINVNFFFWIFSLTPTMLNIN